MAGVSKSVVARSNEMAPVPGSAAEVSSPKVCIVETDPEERAALAHLLGHLPVPVSTFDSAEALLDALEGLDCRVLISDLSLPGKSGLELLQELSARGHRVPTILLAEGSDVGTAVHAMRAGAMDFMEKPVIDRILLRRVKDVLARPPAS